MEHADRPAPAPMEQPGSSAVAITSDPASSSARTAPRIVVLSDDPVLLDAIGTAALDLGQVIVSPSSDRFIDQVVALGGGLALIDAAAVPDSLAEFLRLLHRQFPQLQLLLAGPGTVQHQIGTQMTDGTVFRFVHKPASAQRLKLLLEAALRDRQTRITAQILESPAPDRSSPAAPSGPGRRRWPAAALAVSALIALAGAAIWYASQGRHPADRSTAAQSAAKILAQPPAAPPPGAAPTEQEAIDRAAAERYQRAEQQPGAEAEAGLAPSEQLGRTDGGARAAQVHQLVQNARSRIASGALVEPADDSALRYVTAAWEQAPDDQEVRAVSVALGEAMINAFRAALAAGDLAGGDRWLKACRSYRIAPPALEQMAVQLESYRAAQAAQTAAAQAVEQSTALESDAVVTAAPQSTTPVVTAAPQPTAPAVVAVETPPSPVAQALPADRHILPEASLHRVAFNPPEYPPQALRRHQTGIVELDFTVTPAGTVTDIQVTKSDPVGVFEQASIAALSRDRYEPVRQDGVPVAQRAHIRMRFAL